MPARDARKALHCLLRRGEPNGTPPGKQSDQLPGTELSHSCVVCRICGGSVLCMSADQSPLRDSLDAWLSMRAARGKGGRPRDHRRALGRYGERIALEHLRACGFTLFTRNYRTRRGEIDLIAFDGRTLIFVEVKTQQLGTLGMRMGESPLEWLSASQLARYRPVAQAWLDDPRHASPQAQSMRFDAIGVLVDEKGAVVDLRHVEGSE